MAEAEFIHVKDKSTGHEYPVRSHLFDDAAHEKTGKDPLGPDGFPVPIKFHTTVNEAAAQKAAEKSDSDKGSAPPAEPKTKTGPKADTTKENG